MLDHRNMCFQGVVCWIFFLLFPRSCVGFEFRLTTRAKNPLGDANALLDFLGRPVHWPQIVASSNKVESNSINVEDAMKPGQSVDEVFGLGLLSVRWTCTESGPGRFVVQSPSGVPGIAKDCSMTFDIADNTADFTMGYVPESPLAYLATPILVVDNWLALNVLLPASLDSTPLESFRKLMGMLYGVAGLAHAADLGFGGSILFTSVGLPPFLDLPPAGQAYAILWCVVGPLAFLLSHTDTKNRSLADLGLLMYGLVETVGALVTGNHDTAIHAVTVQVIVLAAWLYSRQKHTSRQRKLIDS